jgi:hypothetical protein
LVVPNQISPRKPKTLIYDFVAGLCPEGQGIEPADLYTSLITQNPGLLDTLIPSSVERYIRASLTKLREDKKLRDDNKRKGKGKHK